MDPWATQTTRNGALSNNIFELCPPFFSFFRFFEKKIVFSFFRFFEKKIEKAGGDVLSHQENGFWTASFFSRFPRVEFSNPSHNCCENFNFLKTNSHET
jgi:hypothetical protein